MSSIFTQADHLNLIFIHYQDRQVTLIPVRTHSHNEHGLRKSIRCPYKIGTLYSAITTINMVTLHHNSLVDIPINAEPELLATDVLIPADSMIMFLGLELIEFEDKLNRKNGLYVLKFLMEETICYYYISVNFKFNNGVWTNDSNLHVENLLVSVLKNAIKPIISKGI